MRGYICDCGGEVEITAFDHCHGPHGIECHDQEVHAAEHCSSDHSEHEDSREHTPLTESVQAQHHSVHTSFVTTPMLAVIATLDPITPFLSLNEPAMHVLAPTREDGRHRRWPQVLTRTIALQV